MVASFWKNRQLIRALVRRDIAGRYKGSFIGLFWALLNPIVMLLMYTFVFGIMFSSKWDGGHGSQSEFALILFLGLILFNIFSECATKSTSVILLNSNYVKKVVFPLEILPVVILGSALFHALISFLIWMVFAALVFGGPDISILLMPFFMAPLLLFCLGLGWLFSSLGVYMRDIGQIVGVFVTGAMFLSPIFYPISALPEKFRFLFQLNPITIPVEQIRLLIIWKKIPEMEPYILGLLGSLLFCYLSFFWFQKTRKGFSDVI